MKEFIIRPIRPLFSYYYRIVMEHGQWPNSILNQISSYCTENLCYETNKTLRGTFSIGKLWSMEHEVILSQLENRLRVWL